MDKGQANGGAALLLIDVINDLASGQIGELPRNAGALVDPILALRGQADVAGVPVIYVNDNFGDWHRDGAAIVEHCAGLGGVAGEIAGRLRPRARDLFVVKPQFSGFYATNLPVVLPQLGVTRLILAGVAADICVLFTAADAHMREYGLWVPADAVASSCAEHRDWALGIMAKSMAAETRPASDLPLAEWLAGGGDGQAGRAAAEAEDEAAVH